MLNKRSLNINIPSSITYIWNFGSLLGFFFFLQILRGLFLILNYINYSNITFDYCIELFFDYNRGWLLHNLHANTASIIFFFLFIHIWRGIYYRSFYKNYLWYTGLLLFLLNIIIAFLGYVLPWGQMSYWGTTVITGLVTVIPYMGHDILYYLWGDKVVSPQTLRRFIVLHFILPFIILIFITSHIIILHTYGSRNPFGLPNKVNTKLFNPSFSIKDIWFFFLLTIFGFILFLNFPSLLLERVNWTEPNPLVTPSHIQPEWYFLFAYGILRSIPNKLGGVTALVLSVLVYFLFPLSRGFIIGKYDIIYKLNFFVYLLSFFLLSLLGRMPVEDPFISLRQTLTMVYFSTCFNFILYRI